MKYEIECAAMITLTIDTGDTTWSPDELMSQSDQVVSEWSDSLADKMAEEFDDCDVDLVEEAGYECKPRRLT